MGFLEPYARHHDCLDVGQVIGCFVSLNSRLNKNAPQVGAFLCEMLAMMMYETYSARQVINVSINVKSVIGELNLIACYIYHSDLDGERGVDLEKMAG